MCHITNSFEPPMNSLELGDAEEEEEEEDEQK